MTRSSPLPRVLSFSLSLLVLLLFQRDILPPLWGVAIPLVLPFLVTVGMTEGPYLAAGLGVVAGLILEQGRPGAYGFSALLFLLVGVAAGLLIFYFRRRLLTAVLFTLAAALFTCFLRWFFLSFLWHGGGGFAVVLLETAMAALLSLPLYGLTHLLSKRFGSLKKDYRLTPKTTKH